MITRLLQPSPLRSFALKALGIFLLWYVLYELWLLPDGRLDHWVALRVIDGAALVTRLFGFEVWMHDRVVTIAGNNGIEMVNGCTGISAIGLFLGFIWAYSGQNRSRLYFSLLGITIINLVNVIRIAALMSSYTTLQARKQGHLPEPYIQQYNSYAFHQAMNTLIKTAPSGTNLMDLCVVLIR